MIFKEIELNEALRIIGEGNPDNNLFFYTGVGSRPDLQNYWGYKIEADDIRKRKWFVRIEAIE